MSQDLLLLFAKIVHRIHVDVGEVGIHLQDRCVENHMLIIAGSFAVFRPKKLSCTPAARSLTSGGFVSVLRMRKKAVAKEFIM